MIKQKHISSQWKIITGFYFHYRLILPEIIVNKEDQRKKKPTSYLQISLNLFGKTKHFPMRQSWTLNFLIEYVYMHCPAYNLVEYITYPLYKV